MEAEENKNFSEDYLDPEKEQSPTPYKFFQGWN